MADQPNPPEALDDGPTEDIPAGMLFAEGSTFADRFRIERMVGAGSMGSVYEAIDIKNDERIALKVLKKEKVPDDEARERFQREAEILASMDHRGVVAIRGFGYAPDGTPWLAMELLEGETLRALVRREGALSAEHVAPILLGAAEALTEAHRRGIVHRDLKPDNIFLPKSQPGAVKILDFGLSKAQSSKKLTATGRVVGTPRYMAPEQIVSSHQSGPQADVYALGVIIYEVLTGQSPFAASDQGQLLGAIIQGRIEPLRNVRPDMPEGVCDAVERALAKSMEDRFATPDDFAVAFVDAVEGRISAPALRPKFSSTRPSAKGRTSKPPSRRWARIGIAVGLVIAAAFFAAVGAGIVYVLMR